MLKIGPNQESERPKYDPCPARKEVTWLNQQVGIIIRNSYRNPKSSKRQREITQNTFNKVEMSTSILGQQDIDKQRLKSNTPTSETDPEDRDIDLIKENKARIKTQSHLYNKRIGKIRKRRKITA